MNKASVERWEIAESCILPFTLIVNTPTTTASPNTLSLSASLVAPIRILTLEAFLLGSDKGMNTAVICASRPYDTCIVTLPSSTYMVLHTVGLSPLAVVFLKPLKRTNVTAAVTF